VDRASRCATPGTGALIRLQWPACPFPIEQAGPIGHSEPVANAFKVGLTTAKLGHTYTQKDQAQLRV